MTCPSPPRRPAGLHGVPKPSTAPLSKAPGFDREIQKEQNEAKTGVFPFKLIERTKDARANLRADSCRETLRAGKWVYASLRISELDSNIE